MTGCLAGHHLQLIGDLAGCLAVTTAKISCRIREPCVCGIQAILVATPFVLRLKTRLLLLDIAQQFVVVLQQPGFLAEIEDALLAQVAQTGDEFFAIPGRGNLVGHEITRPRR
jgi:hypothetical protein